ncbi:MAG: hypothetical protein QM783_12400 [Phycisphaerales bacterium]
MLLAFLISLLSFLEPPAVDLVVETPPVGVIEIEGVLDGKTVALSRVFMVRATLGDVDSISVEASQFMLQGGTSNPGDSLSCSCSAAINIRKDATQPVKVNIQDIARPGLFIGDLVFVGSALEPQTGDKPDSLKRRRAVSQKVRVHLVVHAKSVVKAEPATQSIQVARPSIGVFSWLDSLLLPKGLKPGIRSVCFFNESDWPATPAAPSVTLRRDQSGFDVSAAVGFSAAVAPTLAARTQTFVGLSGLESLSAGRYTGSLRLPVGIGLGAGSAAASIVVEIRDAVYLTVLAIVLGIVAGRWTKPKVDPAAVAKARTDANSLEKIVYQLAGTNPEQAPAHSVPRALVFLGVTFALVVLGIQTFYVNGSAVMGANGLTDYVVPFMWGMGSDIVQRTFQTWVGNQ